MKPTVWIKFEEVRKSESGKTVIWQIFTLDGTICLGEVSWFGRWRKYAFHPERDTVFEQDCLREIATFCEAKTREHKYQTQSGTV